MLITWDGRARVMYLRRQSAVDIRLFTVQPVTSGRVRGGLTLGFVPSARPGPPASVVAALSLGAVPEDVRALLGSTLGTAVDEVLTGDPLRWVRLDLGEVEALAVAWAPYRAQVLEAAAGTAPDDAGAQQVAGRWAAGLWSRLRLADVRDSLQLLFPPDPALGVVRSGPSEPPPDDGEATEALASGSWRLAAEVAVDAGVHPDLDWALRRRGEDVVLEMRVRLVRGRGRQDLLVSVDHPIASWVRFEPDAEQPDVLVAVLSRDTVSGAEDVRFRTVRPDGEDIR